MRCCEMFEIVKPIQGYQVLLLRRESSWARRLMMSSPSNDRAAPWLPAVPGFLERCHLGLRGALGLLMPEPHQASCVGSCWHGKSSSCTKRRTGRLVLRPNVQKCRCIVSSPQAESSLRDSSTLQQALGSLIYKCPSKDRLLYLIPGKLLWTA